MQTALTAESFDEKQMTVHEWDVRGAYFEVSAEPGCALDFFDHPYAYAAR